MKAFIVMLILIFVVGLAVKDHDEKMQLLYEQCAAEGGVLIDTSSGFICYRK